MNIINEIKDSIRKGNGRAFLLLQKNKPKNFTQMLLNAVKTQAGYDTQCEESRVEYYSELIEFSPDKQKIKRLLIESLFRRKDYMSGEYYQHFSMVAKLMRVEFPEEKNRLYELYQKMPRDSRYYFIDILYKNEGLPALLFIINDVLRDRRENGDYYIDVVMMPIWFDTEKERRDAYKFLRSSYHDKRALETLLQKAKKRPRFRRSKFGRTLKSTMDMVYSEKELRGTWPRRIKPVVLQKVAKKFQAESDSKFLVNFLRIFSVVKYPGNASFLAKILAEHKSNKKIVGLVLEALAHFQGPEIRALGLSYVKLKAFRFEGLRLLCANAQKTDIPLILREYNSFNIHLRHSLGIDLRSDSVRKNKILKPLYEKLYYDTSCSLCRTDFVKILKTVGLPPRIRAEIPFDCNPEIRKLGLGYGS